MRMSGATQRHAAAPANLNRSPGVQRVRRTLALLLTLGLCSPAHAEGNLQFRVYSVPAPLEWLDSVSVSGHYQTPAGAGSAAALDVSAERNLLTFGVRYSRPHHIFQASGRRSADPQAGLSDLGATVVYTYVPDVPAAGVALTSATVLYVLSGSQTPTYGVLSQTAGLSAGVRLNSRFSAATTATATAVQLTSQADSVLSGNVSSSLVYAQAGTTAYLVPGVSVQNGQAIWNVSGGASTRLSPALTAAGTAFWSRVGSPSASAALNYAAGPWQLSTTAAYVSQDVSVGVGARLTLPGELNIGAGIALIPSSLTPVYTADLSKQAGGLRFGVGASLSAPPDADSALTAQASVSGQRQPWQGNLYVSYSRSPASTSGNASGTLNYQAGAFGTQLGLGLTLGRAVGSAALSVNGRADLTLNYQLTRQLDLSGSARYERSVAATAAVYRYGVGLRYRFPGKESP